MENKIRAYIRKELKKLQTENTLWEWSTIDAPLEKHLYRDFKVLMKKYKVDIYMKDDMVYAILPNKKHIKLHTIDLDKEGLYHVVKDVDKKLDKITEAIIQLKAAKTQMRKTI